MDFPRTVTIDACEEFLMRLPEKDKEPLELPVDTRSFAFGGLASAIQVINTWMRQSEHRALLLRPSPSGRKDIIAEVINRPHKFAAAMCAKSIASAANDSEDLRQEIYLVAKAAIEAQGKAPYGQQRGGLCWFTFVDHSSKAFDKNFYIEQKEQRPGPRGAEQIESVVVQMIKKATEVAGGAAPLLEEQSSGLGRILFELFLNTHEHGTRADSRSHWLRPGTRTVYVNAVNLTESAVEKISGDQTALNSYIFPNAIQENKKRYVEIGIVDSGLGYCDRWLADRGEPQSGISIEKEYSIFRRCFQFRQTSTSLDSKGNGLPAVMDNLTRLKGFMRIRSGRLSIYRNFVQDPFKTSDDCYFNDWNTGLTDVMSALPKAAGVSISILVPLEAKR